MEYEAYVPERYLPKQGWFKRDPKDNWGRSPYVQLRDRIFGVADYQLDVRYGRVVHQIVPHVPEERNFVYWVEEQCDKLVALCGNMPLTPKSVDEKYAKTKQIGSCCA